MKNTHSTSPTPSRAASARASSPTLRAVLVAAALFGGCRWSLAGFEDGAPAAPSAPSGAFDFRTTAATSLEVAVQEDAGPVAGAVVVLREPMEDGGASSPLWQGRTGGDGLARAFFVRPVPGGALELTVFRAGYRGAYDDESMRTTHGDFAPAAWFRLADARASRVVVQLERR